MLRFTRTMLLLCTTIRDNFSGQKDVCSGWVHRFHCIDEENLRIETSQCDIENSIGVRERIIIYYYYIPIILFAISQQMSTRTNEEPRTEHRHT